MAEGFLRAMAGDRFEAQSAGTEKTSVHPLAIRAMAGATPLTPNFNTGINALLGDGVGGNDKPLPTTFPYIASPHAGNR
jgi:hypothetical protein